MNPLEALEALIGALPELVADGGKTVSDVAHGEGGVGKITKLAGDLATLLAHVALGLAGVHPEAAQAATTQPAATAG